MSASNKTLLVVCLLLAGAALSACSSLVTVDRTKVKDPMFEVPKPDAGSDEDAGD